ncbi:MarR family transcriptional regulator [Amycolatopsis taiwanensis]|uniref:MarR family transcriptional regulator n=1 Tax=Amycolatopsis taiwanensis TaxID=342230 RepID=A0A9W6VCW1_9PSEU|nr:MarR family transcriptional regulator [Amycolatopsis taiwanensis]
MPGGRLTLEDRQRIAAWLREGIRCAEIARRLGRPRSTINREVARNGGPDDYRADQANKATLRRARRRAPAPGPGAPQDPDEYGRDAATVGEFTERFTALMVRTGLPPMPSRVLACLFTSDGGAFTAAELVQRLRVSPASISKAIAYLEQLELVRRERDTQGRRERYLIDDDVWYRAWSASTKSITMWADTAKHGADILGTATPAGARLRNTGQFFQLLAEDMTRAAEHRRRTFPEIIRQQ